MSSKIYDRTSGTGRPLRQRLDEVGPGHDANELAIEHDRQTSDPFVLQNSGGRLDAPHGTDRDDRAGHHLADRGTHRPLVLTHELLAVLEEPAPPGPLAAPRLTKNEVAFADDADEPPVVVDNGQPAHAVLHHQLRGLVDGRRRAHRDHVPGHDFFDCHRGSASVVSLLKPRRPRGRPASAAESWIADGLVEPHTFSASAQGFRDSA